MFFVCSASCQQAKAKRQAAFAAAASDPTLTWRSQHDCGLNLPMEEAVMSLWKSVLPENAVKAIDTK